MAIFSLTTAKTVVYSSVPGCIMFAISNTGADDVNVFLDGNTTAAGTIAPGNTLPFRLNVSGCITKVECAANASTSTVDVAAIWA